MMPDLIELVEEKPTSTLAELQRALKDLHGSAPSESTLSSWLHLQIFSIKKVNRSPTQRNTEVNIQKRKEYCEWLCALDSPHIAGLILDSSR
eukprot:m.223249 g.223249  ORF g.223249 m.223249 type:complete len:92 (+) comp54185_c0_seq37:318-593(+)